MVPIVHLNRTCLFNFRPNKSETIKVLFPIFQLVFSIKIDEVFSTYDTIR